MARQNLARMGLACRQNLAAPTQSFTSFPPVSTRMLFHEAMHAWAAHTPPSSSPSTTHSPSAPPLSILLSAPLPSSPPPPHPSPPPPSPPPPPSATRKRPSPSGEEATVVIVGRPNVGKSALFNRLIRRREALVLDTPQGHMTRDVREGTGHLFGLSFRVFDTAGLEPLYAPPPPPFPTPTPTLVTDTGAGTPNAPGAGAHNQDSTELRNSGGVSFSEDWEGRGGGGGGGGSGGGEEGGVAESAAGPSPPSVLRRTASITSFLVQQADAVLFLFDARAGLLPGDTEVADWLRTTLASPPLPNLSTPHPSSSTTPLGTEGAPSLPPLEAHAEGVPPAVHQGRTPPSPSPSPRVILVANKCEGFWRDHRGQLLAHVAEAYGLGFGDPVPISAETGEGLDDLFARLQDALPSAEDSPAEDDSLGLLDNSLAAETDSLAVENDNLGCGDASLAADNDLRDGNDKLGGPAAAIGPTLEVVPRGARTGEEPPSAAAIAAVAGPSLEMAPGGTRTREAVPAAATGPTLKVVPGRARTGEAVEAVPSATAAAATESTVGVIPPLQLAIAGVPNVGKSTLVNALLGAERVLTGPEPGLTRDSVRVRIMYQGEPIWLVDTAGWLKRAETAEKGPASLAQVDTERSLMRAHVVVLVVDGVEVTTEQKAMRRVEQSLARWVLQNGRALVLAVNKMDAIVDITGKGGGPPPNDEEDDDEEGGRERVREGATDGHRERGGEGAREAGGSSGKGAPGASRRSEPALDRSGLRNVDLSSPEAPGALAPTAREEWKHRRWLRKRVRAAVTAEVGSILQQVPEVPVVFVSALRGQGREELMEAVGKAYAQWGTTVSPSQLRHWLPKVLLKLPGQRAAASVRSLSQLKARPPTFAVTGARNNPPSPATLKFLASEIARSFKMESVPIRTVVRMPGSTIRVRSAAGRTQKGNGQKGPSQDTVRVGKGGRN